MGLPEYAKSVDDDAAIFRHVFSDPHKQQPDKRRRYDIPIPTSDAELLEDVQAIARRFQAHAGQQLTSTDHGELLYDEGEAHFFLGDGVNAKRCV